MTPNYVSTRLLQVALFALAVLLTSAGCRDPNELEGSGSVSVRATPRAGSQAVDGSGLAPDSVRAVVHGSGVNVGTKLAPGANGSFTGTIKNVPAGTYHVTVEGLVGGETDLYGVTSGVVVEAGKTAETSPSFGSFVPSIGNVPEATIAPRFRVTWEAIAGADSYSVEVARSADFAGATRVVSPTPELLVTLSDSGAHFIRGRALSGFVQRSRPSSSASITALVNSSEPGDNTSGNATALGFGAGASGEYSGFNILPAGDVDWFSVGLCTGDELQVGVKAARLDPPSFLNSHVVVVDPRDTVLAANNDYEGSDDSYTTARAAMNGVHRIRVQAAEGSAGRVGQYELVVSVKPGPNVVSGGCRSVPGSTVHRVSITPEVVNLATLGASQALNAQVLDDRGGAVPGTAVTWSSSNPTVAVVGSTSGVVQATGAGQTVISATSDGVVGYALVTVSPAGAGAVGSWAAATSGVNYALNGVFGTSPPDFFTVVGAGGGLLRLSGGGWTSGVSGVGRDLYRVWGFGTGEGYAVGAQGMILRYQAGAGTAMASGTTQPLYGIWGSSPRNLIAVGGAGTVLRFDGARWSAQNSGTTQALHGVFGVSPASVFAVGENGTIVRFDGSQWASMSSGTQSSLYAVWGSGPNDVWAVGAAGTILRYNGSSWSSVSSGSTARLTAIWGTSSADVYAVGTGGTILRYNGSSWSALTSGSNQDLHGVWGSYAGSVYAVGAGGVILRGTRGTGTAAARVDITPAGAQAGSGTVAFSAQAYDAAGNPLASKTFLWTALNPDVATMSAATGVATVVGSGQTVVVATVDGAVGHALLTTAVSGTTPVGGYRHMPIAPVPALHDVWGTAGNQVYAVGLNGTVMRYDGLSWNAVASGTSTTLNAVWGSSGTDVFAVGNAGAAVHFDGSAWRPINTGTSQELRGLWGASPTDVFAVGNAGTILRYTGTGWSGMSSGTSQTLHGVWGTHRANVYAVGAGGTILRYNGSSWTAMSSGVSVALRGIWGTSDQSIYAVGEGGTILRYDGSSWTRMTVPPISSDVLTSIWGSSAGDVYVAGSSGRILRYNGSYWVVERSPTPHSVNGVWGAPTGGVYLVGDGGAAIFGRRGAAYITVTPGGTTATAGTTQGFTAVAVDANGQTLTRTFTWASLNPAIMTVSASGTATAVSAGQAAVSASVDGISGYALLTVVAGSASPVTAWSAVSSSTSQALRGVWAHASDHVYAVGASGTIVQWNGSAWSGMSTPTAETLYGIWGASPSTVWAVGVDAGKLKFTGAAWEVVELPRTPERYAIWGSGPDALFSVGDSGTTIRYDGWAWSVLPSGTTRHLRGVWGTSATNVYAVGAAGTIIRWDGTAWSPMPTSGSWRGLRAIWGTSANDAYAVGDTGTIIRWNGTTWSAMTSGTLVNLNGVTGTSSGDIYAVGDGGVILRYNGSAWTVMSQPTGGTTFFSGLGIGSTMWVVGSGGTILRGTR